jgi:fatty-acyl-CoA synthase
MAKALYGHVSGAPDKRMLDEVPVAFVEAEITPGRDLASDILASCRASLAKFKVPRRVVIMSELPRVGNAKIARAKLRQML